MSNLSVTRQVSFSILALAVILGGGLRCYRLSLQQMTGDEGAAWAGARASTVGEVVRLQQQFDPGKLALYDVIAHEWISVFGDRLSALRALPAGIATVSIVLVFLVVRELYDALASASEIETGELAAAYAALIFATDVTMVDIGRMARMYALMAAAELVHLLFFVRAQRRGGVGNCAAAAFFLALAIGSNFSAVFLLTGECVWLGYVLLAQKTGMPGADLRMLGPSLSLVAGVALLAPFAPGATTASLSAIQAGYLNWIKARSLAWPYAILRTGTGNRWLFWLFLAMAAFGVWRQWRSARLVPLFVGAWMAGPFLAVTIVTWTITPLMVWRYVVIAFVAFFALAAIGAASLRTIFARGAVALLILGLSCQVLYGYFRSPREADWEHAAAVAAGLNGPDGQIAVVPSYAINVMRYYLPEPRRGSVVGLEVGCGTQRVLVLSGRNYLPSSFIAPLERCYPHMVSRLRRVEVRSR